ncbi:MAG: hypothetical protein IH851_02090 [Armatimonadetes bacterium]|nr:hypothetical protein [Armatimonadota bacterium]
MDGNTYRRTFGRYLSLSFLIVFAITSGFGHTKPSQKGQDALVDLSVKSQELKTAFNAAKGKVRLVIILSPT